LHVVDIAEPT